MKLLCHREFHCNPQGFVQKHRAGDGVFCMNANKLPIATSISLSHTVFIYNYFIATFSKFLTSVVIMEYVLFSSQNGQQSEYIYLLGTLWSNEDLNHHIKSCARKPPVWLISGILKLTNRCFGANECFMKVVLNVRNF